jgi:hypothetical protein
VPKPLDLSVQAFVKHVPIDVMERYLSRLKIEHRDRDWLYCNAAALDNYMADPKNAETSALIRADFQRLSDIAQDALGLLVQAYRRFLIPFNADLPREHLAMLLYLDHPDAFEYAWSRFLLFDGTSTVSVLALPDAQPQFGSHAQAAFQTDVQCWFADQAKGEYCNVAFYDDIGEVLIRVQRGTYVQTLQYWSGPRVGTDSRRPAIEDLLIFERDTKLLRIKARLEKEREEYLRLFCQHVVGDSSLADRALNTEVFSLAPIQSNTFDYGGDGLIGKVELRRVRLRLFGTTNAVLDLKAEDVREALQYDVQGLPLTAGVLLSATLRFTILVPGQRAKMLTVRIDPPLHTNLHERPYADRVLKYLEMQGVKLR